MHYGASGPWGSAMKWPFRAPKLEAKVDALEIFTRGAARAFEEVASGANSAAELFRNEPVRKSQMWRTINEELSKIVSDGERSRITINFRTALANSLEFFVSANFYNNLGDGDKDLWARLILSSTKQEQDQVYYYAEIYNYVWCEILQFIIFNAWDGGDEGLKYLKDMCGTFRDTCIEHCKLVLVVARAKNKGQEITPAEKESGKTTAVLKEAARRRVAGEKFDDE
jgi:hypothetical protein